MLRASNCKAAALVTLLALLLTACGDKPQVREADPASARQTRSGPVVGFADRFDTFTWLGIPFAAPPVGELRWRAPQPVPPWQETLQALSWGEMCPQFPIPVVSQTDKDFLGAEDCLYLNVSAPRAWSAGDTPLPVMFWIHGGGNALGSADLYNAVRNLAARENVVVVNIHYRLGLLGWFSHPALRAQAANALDASGNYGTLDTIAALQWVRDNIGAFGGDPGNVTIFGESAGGMNVFALLLSPLAEGLFHRAIGQSGILITTTLAAAEQGSEQLANPNNSEDLLRRLLVADGSAAHADEAAKTLAGWDSATTAAYLRGKSPEELLAQTQGRRMGMYPAASLLRDGTVLPADEPLDAFGQGRFNRVPIILGTNRDEMKTMMMSDPAYTDPLFGVLPRVKNRALYDRVTGYGSDMWKATGADEPARAILASGHEDIWVYRFDWDQMPSPWYMDLQALLGAGHGLEIPFVFHDLDGEMTFMPLAFFDDNNRDSAADLAGAMSAYWGQFARAGNPGSGGRESLPAWPSWTDAGSLLVFDTAADGGIRPDTGVVDRDSVYLRLAADADGLGSTDERCRAYRHLFGEQGIFGFTATCPDRVDCPGAPANFCDSATWKP